MAAFASAQGPFSLQNFLQNLQDTISIGATPAQAAVVYCKAVGVPKGCVVRRPVVAPVVVAPVVVAPVVVAPRVGVYRRPANLGGPVNRVGRR